MPPELFCFFSSSVARVHALKTHRHPSTTLRFSRLLCGIQLRTAFHFLSPTAQARSRGQLTLLEVFPQRDEQLARQGNDANLATPSVAVAEPTPVPARQLAVWLPT